MNKESRRKLKSILKRFDAWRKNFSSIHLDFVISGGVTITYEMVSANISEMQAFVKANEAFINEFHNNIYVKNMQKSIATSVKLLLFTKDLPKNENNNN